MTRFVGLLALIFTILGGGAGHVFAQANAVTIAMQLNSDVPMLLVARDKELWAKAGLDVKVIPFNSGREAFEAMVGGQTDLNIMADLPAVIGMLRKQNFKIVADVSRYRGQRIIASKKLMNLKSFSDLNGKRVGVTVGTSSEYFLRRALAAGPAEATIVNLQPADLVPALVRGDIDAAVTFPTFYSQAAKLLGADYQELFLDGYASHVVLAASTKILKERPEVVATFLKVAFEANEMVLKDPKVGQDAVIRASKGVVQQAVIETVWPQHDFKLVLDDAMLSFLSSEAAWILDKGVIKADPAAASVAKILPFIDDRALRQVAPGNVQLPPAQ